MSEIDKRLTEIDKRLTEININELVKQIGIPFAYISDKEIESCVNEKIFLETNVFIMGLVINFHIKMTIHLI